jgi:hypothetical protein
MDEKTITSLLQILAIFFVGGALVSIITALFSKAIVKKFFLMGKLERSVVLIGLFIVPFVLSLQMWVKYNNKDSALAVLILISGSVFLLSLLVLILRLSKIKFSSEETEKEDGKSNLDKKFLHLSIFTLLITLLDLFSVVWLILTKQIFFFYIILVSSTLLALIMVFWLKSPLVKGKTNQID